MDFEEFYNLNFKKVYKFYYNKFVDAGSVDDLVQESFCRLYSKYESLNSEERSKVLFGISKNLYKMWVVERKKTVNIDDIEKVIYKNEQDSEDFLEENEEKDYENEVEKQKEIILKAFGELSSNVRKVLEMRFLDGKSRKEIAAELGITEDMVHTYQKRGVKYLSKIINAQPGQRKFHKFEIIIMLIWILTIIIKK